MIESPTTLIGFVVIALEGSVGETNLTNDFTGIVAPMGMSQVCIAVQTYAVDATGCS